MVTSPIAVARLSAVLLAACAGPKPQPLSAEEHLAQAEHHERKAEEHEGKHHLDWTPTPGWEAEAARYREFAAKHRTASAALRDAEARACAGIEDDDRDESPFVHKADILEVQEINVTEGKQLTTRRRGASIVVRAVGGLTAQWLQRLVDCRVAENAALGYDVPEFPDDPLAVPGVTTSVTALSNAFAVNIEHDTQDRAREIQRRASLLLNASAQPAQPASP